METTDSSLLDQLADGIVARMNKLPAGLSERLRPGTTWHLNLDGLCVDSTTNLVAVFSVKNDGALELQLRVFGGDVLCTFYFARSPRGVVSRFS